MIRPPATAYLMLGAVLAWQGQPEEAEPWVQRAERTIRAEAEPAAGVGVHHVRGVLELAHGRDADALAAFQAAERLARPLAAPNLLVTAMRAFLVQTLVRLGETERAEQAIAGLGEQERERGELRMALAVLRLTQDDPHAAIAALAPVLDGSAPLVWPTWLAQAFLLEAIARDALGDEDAAGRALERALDCAEPDGALLPFLLHPVPGLLERHARRRTSHAALIVEILSLLAGWTPAPPRAGPRPPLEPMSESELRVLRYLPTNLSGPEIAGELYVSHNTVRTHITPPVRQARHAHPGRGRRPRPGPRPAGPLPAAGQGHASWLTAGAATRCRTAGPWAPGLQARGRLPGAGEAGIRPGEPALRHRCCGGAH